MKLINLKSRKPINLQAQVDNEDFEYLNKFNWYLNKGYAIRATLKREGRRIIKMHREVIGALKHHKMIDHIDRNRLNNQKSNLRFCNQSENQLNHKPRYRNNTSGKNGISWHKNRKKWQAYIIKNNEYHYIGLFTNINDAVYARQKAYGQMVAAEQPVQNKEQAGTDNNVPTQLPTA